jgi:hypothetical protein
LVLPALPTGDHAAFRATRFALSASAIAIPRSAPVDAAEAVLPEQRVEDADRVAHLPAVRYARECRVAPVAEVAQRDGVLAMDSPGERGVEAEDVVVAATRSRGDVADEVLAPVMSNAARSLCVRRSARSACGVTP